MNELFSSNNFANVFIKSLLNFSLKISSLLYFLIKYVAKNKVIPPIISKILTIINIFFLPKISAIKPKIKVPIIDAIPIIINNS